MGEDLLDDVKTSVDLAYNLYEINNFIADTAISFQYKRDQNLFLKKHNLGLKSALGFDYYQEKWFLKIKYSFDKSMIAHFKHTDIVRENYLEISDGWYKSLGAQ